MQETKIIDKNKSEQQIEELIYKNSILFEQLNLVQNELEKYYYKVKKYEQNFSSLQIKQNIIVPSEAKKALIENTILQTIVEQQKKILEIEIENSLSARLGKVLINSVDSIWSIIYLPFKLYKIWKLLERKTPPTTLGGEDFHKVIEAYNSNGIKSVESLLDNVCISSVMRANAYTALARNLMQIDIHQAVIFAQLAWQTDPRPYRLKWLAFRQHEAGNTIIAEALLHILPSDIKMSDSEKRHVNRIYKESNFKRTNKIEKLINQIKHQTIQESKNLLHNSYIKDDQKNIQEIKKQYQQEVNYLKEQINLLKNNNRSYEEYKQELDHLKIKLEEQQKNADKIHHELTQKFYEEQEALQNLVQKQKIDIEAFTSKTSIIFKNLLTDFNNDTITLSHIMRIIMGINISK